MRARVILFAIFIWVCNPLASQINQDIGTQADNYLKQLHSLNRFRGNVLIAKEGKIIYHGSFGLANMEDSVPNALQTRFPIASLTKAFTATAVMMLQERGLLSVNDPISKYLDFTTPIWKGVTIHHLLTHTSGIPDYSEDSLWMEKRSSNISFHQTLSLFQGKPLSFAPGTKYSYSNSGYTLLSYIIEEVSGMSYDQFIVKNIFEPLRMRNTFIDDNKMIIARKARGYVRDGLELQNAPYLNMELVKPAGGLVSTTEDILVWDQSFYTDKLLKSKSRKRMFTPFLENYGYGWLMDSLNGAMRISGNGAALGYRINIDRYPEQNTTVIIFCNSYDVFINAAIRDLGAIALGKPYKMPPTRRRIVLPVEKRQGYAGTYQSTDGQLFVIRQQDEQLEVEYKRSKYKLFAENETNFFSDEYDGQIMFTFERSGTTTHLLYNKKVKAVKL